MNRVDGDAQSKVEKSSKSGLTSINHSQTNCRHNLLLRPINLSISIVTFQCTSISGIDIPSFNFLKVIVLGEIGLLGLVGVDMLEVRGIRVVLTVVNSFFGGEDGL